MFESVLQHSYENLQNLISRLESNSLTFAEKISQSTLCVQHGIKNTDRLIENLKPEAPDLKSLDYLNKLLKQYRFIEAIPNIESFEKQPQLIRELYSKNGFHFFRGYKNQDKLVVLFTTMYNNFYVSNFVMLRFLSQFGVSILILKDTTRFNYLNGVSGFGKNPKDISKQILTLKEREGIKKVLIMGFSSGGFASLLCAKLLQSDRYLGFSIASDTSGSLTDRKWFTQEVRSKIDEKYLFNLRDLLANEEQSQHSKYNIYYGLDNKSDVDHAINLDDLPNVSLQPIEDCGHSTISRLMERFELKSIVHGMIFDTD